MQECLDLLISFSDWTSWSIAAGAVTAVAIETS